MLQLYFKHLYWLQNVFVCLFKSNHGLRRNTKIIWKPTFLCYKSFMVYSKMCFAYCFLTRIKVWHKKSVFTFICWSRNISVFSILHMHIHVCIWVWLCQVNHSPVCNLNEDDVEASNVQTLGRNFTVKWETSCLLVSSSYTFEMKNMCIFIKSAPFFQDKDFWFYDFL